MNLINRHINRILSLAMTLAALLIGAPQLKALPIATYAESSVLSEGNWVKVSVAKSGAHIITNAALKQMGFSDPSKVRIYGYGAMRLPDVLDDSYIDDLPVVQSLLTPRGIIFYAQGPLSGALTSEGGEITVPVQNPFTTLGYYFLSDRPEDLRTPIKAGQPTAVSPATTFTDAIYHENEYVSLGQTGHFLVGEDFLYNTSQTFNFTLTDRVESTPVDLECSFVAKANTTSYVHLSANGKSIDGTSSTPIGATTDSHGHYREGRASRRFEMSGSQLAVGVRYAGSGVRAANLNYLSVNYVRKLALNGASLMFATSSPSCRLAGADNGVHVWDVTSPLDIFEMNTRIANSGMEWTNDLTGRRNYVAFSENGTLPEPKFVSQVVNQNLHGLEVPDMVIFTPGAWRDQAVRLADFHRNGADKLNVLVVNQDDVFNEFGSGSRDPNAFRKMLKMLYDRSANSETRLQYALFFGRGIYDNRAMTASVKAMNYPMMPIWESEGGVSDTDSFTTDDIFAFLEDGSGARMSADYYSIAVGRLPVTSTEAARGAVDKIIDYATNAPRSAWRNRMLMIADDEDYGIHMEQAESIWREMMASDGGADINYHKLYTDRFERRGGSYPQAREEMFRTLDEGVAWWFFIGHANTSGWTHENLLTYTDINNLYLRHYPIVMAATCDFLRWDAIDVSAAEIMWGLPSGGSIAIISANRPVYISDNGNLTRAFGRNTFARDASGRRQTIGQIYRNSKNDYRVGSAPVADSNKLRYVLMGDPALYPVTPDDRVVITSINGIDPDADDDQAIMQARQDVTVEGYVADVNGNIVTDFNGVASSDLYDAEYSVTTFGNGDAGKPIIFDQQGDRIFSGNDSIKDGRFKIRIAMPSTIADNFRPAALNIYARSHDAKADNRQAASVSRNFYVFGEDESAVDNTAPEIRTMFINHPTFVDGDKVNPSPMLIAEIADNRGINMSQAGLGRQMQLLLDEKTSLADVSQYFTPSLSESAAGTIAYPLQGLADGPHTLRLRVWDTSNNSATAVINFEVSAEEQPLIYDIYADANPASVETNFYLSHNRPEAVLEVTIEVFNLLGQPVWSTTTSGRSDMYVSMPINWNLCNYNGRRVPRGIYLYRARIKADGVESSTTAKRIAVTG